MSTELLEDTKLDGTDTSDPDKMAHYVKKDKIADASIFGTGLEALCGHVFVPTKDHQKYPVCPRCKEIYEQLRPA